KWLRPRGENRTTIHPIHSTHAGRGVHQLRCLLPSPVPSIFQTLTNHRGESIIAERDHAANHSLKSTTISIRQTMPYQDRGLKKVSFPCKQLAGYGPSRRLCQASSSPHSLHSRELCLL